MMGATATAAASAHPANKAEETMAVKKDFMVKKRCLIELLEDCVSEFLCLKLACFYIISSTGLILKCITQDT